MGWPQILMIVLFSMRLGASLYNHGKSQESKPYSFYSECIGTAIVVFILWCGGFF